MIESLRGITTVRDKLTKPVSVHLWTCGACGCLVREDETCPKCRARLEGKS